MKKGVEIKFTKDFATKKADEVWKCDGMLASHLVRKDKVAKYVGKAKAKPKAESKPKKKA